MKSSELGALIAALHRANQLGYPIMIIGAGLPKIYTMLSEEKSYSERLFIYTEIDSLEAVQAEAAIRKPAEKLNVTYTEEAVQKVIEVTKGYPLESIPVTVDTCVILPPFSYATKSPGLKL